MLHVAMLRMADGASRESCTWRLAQLRSIYLLWSSPLCRTALLLLCCLVFALCSVALAHTVTKACTAVVSLRCVAASLLTAENYSRLRTLLRQSRSRSHRSLIPQAQDFSNILEDKAWTQQHLNIIWIRARRFFVMRTQKILGTCTMIHKFSTGIWGRADIRGLTRET